MDKALQIILQRIQLLFGETIEHLMIQTLRNCLTLFARLNPLLRDGKMILPQILFIYLFLNEDVYKRQQYYSDQSISLTIEEAKNLGYHACTKCIQN